MAEPASSLSPAASPATSDVHDGEAVDVSIILPIFNEVEHLKQEVDRIRASMDASEYSYEIIAVDDGSSDGSGELAQQLGGMRVISFLQNRGSGSARKAGTNAARGRVTVWTDVDMTYPNDTIPNLVKELDGYDQVVGARTTEEGTKKALRVPAKWFIRKLASFLTSTKIPDLNSGFRAFRTVVAKQYTRHLPPGFSCVTTMTMTFLANGYSVKYIPIEYGKRAGESKFHPIKDTRRYGTQVVRMVLSYNPLAIFMPIGLGLLALGIGKGIYDVVRYDFRPTTNTLLLLFAAMQIIVIGLLADLVVRVSKDRDEVAPASYTKYDAA
jgi:glycosyltransferase involved in cell wall biosynthesis